MTKYCVVDGGCYEADFYHAPYMNIVAKSPNKAKYAYHKIYPEYKYVDLICWAIR